jgi:methionine synthase II (cobalamin-independent)
VPAMGFARAQPILHTTHRAPRAKKRPGGNNMANRIQTTHAGSLPRPAKLIDLNHRRIDGEKIEDATFDRELKDAVVDLVGKQKGAGVDLVNDGEFGHTMGYDYDYGAWWSYVVRRLNGVEVVPVPLWELEQVPRGLRRSAHRLRAARSVHGTLQPGGARPDHLQGP